MVLIVHDEVIFEVHESEHHIIPKLKFLLSEFEMFRIPITAGVENGNPSWGTKKPTPDVECKEPSVEEYKMMLNYNVFNDVVEPLVKLL